MSQLYERETQRLNVGDRVALASDPSPELRQGTVVHEEQNNSRLFVSWDYGRTWVYAKKDLVRV